jgi:hypothetical protein
VYNYQNLKYFIITKALNRKQNVWAKLLITYNFEILYRKEVLNSADKLSRRPNYEKYTKIKNQSLLPIFQNKLKKHRAIEICENAEKANIKNIRIAVLTRQKISPNLTTIANAEIKYILVKVKEVARTQAQYEKFFIEKTENSNKFMIKISIQNYAQIMSRNIVNFAIESISRYKEFFIFIISLLLHIQSMDD